LLTFIKDDILKDTKEDLEMVISELISETSVTSVTSTDDNTSNAGRRKKIKYDKVIYEYFLDVYNGVESTEIINRAELENRVKTLIKKESGVDIHPGTLMAQARMNIINDRVRVNYGVNNENVDKYNLFYFIDENKTGKKDLMKKYLIDYPPKGFTIFYRDKKTKEDCKITID
jgi:hypothetical protein